MLPSPYNDCVLSSDHLKFYLNQRNTDLALDPDTAYVALKGSDTLNVIPYDESVHKAQEALSFNM